MLLGQQVASADRFPIAIIGAGFGGIGAAIKLKEAGFDDIVIFERADDIGGTWRDNTYPGAACDVPSHVYSFSFEPNPDWSSVYAGSAEIKSYLDRVVDKHDLRKLIRFGKTATEARFDEQAGVWRIAFDDGEAFVARAVVSAMGGLVDPQFPDINGLRDFKGELIHTARWNHDYDLEGKRVAVIGTGASAIQVVPSIAPKVGKMFVMQRTPAWVMPKPDFAISEEKKARFRRFPFLMRMRRRLIFWLSEFFGPMIMLDSERLSSIGEKRSRRHLENCVKDPELREKLTPDFQLGCKRILISNDYWPSLARDNVELVTDGIESITETGIRTVDGRDLEVDAIVCATGFEVNITKTRIPLYGLGGRSLADVWADGPEAYKGMIVSGFPNWYSIMGPNTGPGHTSVLIYSEAQIGYIVQAVSRLRERGLKYLDVLKSVQDRYNEKIQARMKYTVWTSGCASWYLDDKGRNYSLYPGFASEYRMQVKRFKPSEYNAVPLPADFELPLPAASSAAVTEEA